MTRDPIPARNIRIGRRRTSVRMEPEFWTALGEICRADGTTVNEIATIVGAAHGEGGFTSRLRVYVMQWFLKRAAV